MPKFVEIGTSLRLSARVDLYENSKYATATNLFNGASFVQF